MILADTGSIEYAVLDIGGFLGMGEHRISVAFAEIQVLREIDGKALSIYVDATKEQLEQRPEFEG